MGVNRALDAFIWHCAQLVSVGAMRGVAESYYEARRLSYNRINRSSYNAFDPTVIDFDTPAPPTILERLPRPSQLPLEVSPVARSELAGRSPSPLPAADPQLPDGNSHTSDSALPRSVPIHQGASPGR